MHSCTHFKAVNNDAVKTRKLTRLNSKNFSECLDSLLSFTDLSADNLVGAILAGDADFLVNILNCDRAPFKLDPLYFSLAVMSQSASMIDRVLQLDPSYNVRESINKSTFILAILMAEREVIYKILDLAEHHGVDLFDDKEFDLAIAAKSGYTDMVDLMYALAEKYHLNLKITDETMKVAEQTGNLALVNLLRDLRQEPEKDQVFKICGR